MADSAHTPDEQAAEETLYAERLHVAWWVWPLPLAAAALIAAELHMAFPALTWWLPYVVLIPLAILLVLRMGRTKVAVVRTADGPVLHVADARLPLRFVGEVDVIDKDGKRKSLGPELDPAAFVVHRGWVGTLVRAHLTDPDDPTPYWLFSTRKPQRLAELLRSTSRRSAQR